MPQIEWPTRRIPCATLALVTNSDRFYVRPKDRRFLPSGQEVEYVVTSGNTTSRTTRYAAVHPTRAGDYQLFREPALTGLVSPVAAQFTLEMDAGVVVNYPTRPILTNPSMQVNEAITNPLAVNAYSSGHALYVGSFELDVVRKENAGIVEAFVDQLHDPRNWFELPLPGDHLGTASVTDFSAGTGDITINSTTDDNYNGWWVRVGRRTGRITWHDVGVTYNSGFNYTHKIRITPSTLITGTTGENPDNNFASNKTMRVRATGVSAVGNPDFSGSWVIEFQETDGAT